MDEKEVYRKIGLNIRRLREEKNLSQVELANLCEMEKTNLCRLELGNNNPTIKTLLKISVVLEAPLFELVRMD